MSATRIGMFLSAAGLALMSLYGRHRKGARKLEKSTRKEAVATWEGEGGNLPPGQVNPATTIVPASTK